MGDWRKAQYRIDPPEDPNSDLEDLGMGARLMVPVGLFLLALATLAYWLLTL